MKKGIDFITSFVTRAMFGMLIIYMVNECLAVNGMEMVVGINPVNFLISGMFGLPGIAMLYGIGLY